jgi:ribosomal protein L18E
VKVLDDGQVFSIPLSIAVPISKTAKIRIEKAGGKTLEK